MTLRFCFEKIIQKSWHLIKFCVKLYFTFFIRFRFLLRDSVSESSKLCFFILNNEMTQTELAKEANLMPAAISQFEFGSRKPSFKTLSSLSEALKEALIPSIVSPRETTGVPIH